MEEILIGRYGFYVTNAESVMRIENHRAATLNRSRKFVYIFRIKIQIRNLVLDEVYNMIITSYVHSRYQSGHTLYSSNLLCASRLIFPVPHWFYTYSPRPYINMTSWETKSAFEATLVTKIWALSHALRLKCTTYCLAVLAKDQSDYDFRLKLTNHSRLLCGCSNSK